MKMRKLVAAVLAVLMLCSIIPFSVAADGNSATIDFTTTDNRTSCSTSQQVWKQNGITFTNDKGASTSNVNEKYFNPVRCYKSSTVTIEYPGMTKIEIDSVTYNDNDYAVAWTNSFSADATAVVTDGNVTITFAEPVDSFTWEKMSAQARAYSITVYTGDAGDAPVVPPVTPDEPDEPDVPAIPDGTELTIADAIAMGQTYAHNTFSESKYYVTGVITEIYNNTYGNMKLADEAGNILTIYGTWSEDGSTRFDAMGVKPVAGDTVVLYGVIGQYNGTSQMKNGWIMGIIGGDTPDTPDTPDEPDTPVIPDGPELTIADAIDMGQTYAHNTFSETKYYVTGVITEVYNTQYGNMKLSDEYGNILTIYGSWNEDGTVRYDALENPPVAGDTVVLYGIIGQYNGTSQMKNGWIMGVIGGDTPDTPDEPDYDDEIDTTIPYLLGMIQENLSTEDVYFLDGGMDGYYMTTTTDEESAILVYLEKTNGGYYLYALDEDDNQVYINMVVSGTHVNGVYEYTASTVYNYDWDLYTLVSEVNGELYAFGTRNDRNYTTMGPVKVSYNGFHADLYYFTEEGECEHEYEFIEEIAPTCGEDGMTIYACTFCAEEFAEPIPATGEHTYDDEYDAACNECGATRDVPDKPVEYAGTIEIATVTGAAGETVNVNVTLPNNPGIVSAKVKVYFDTTVLNFVACTEGDFALGGYSTSDPELANQNGYFIINWCDATHPDVTAELLAVLSFQILPDAEEGSYALTVEFSCEDDMFNDDDETVWFSPVDGAVNVVNALPGDADGDGRVNNRDLGLLQQYLNEYDMSNKNFNEAAIDLDGNGKVNNRDLGALQKLLNA